uniref:Col_cuticle_N domain-containing protein n=2 Tax=Caenorhabditis tropicalis TaxID=1561998 RepID=A0A1I7UIE4_9PELO
MSMWTILLILNAVTLSTAYEAVTMNEQGKSAFVVVIILCVVGAIAISISVGVGIFLMNRRNSDQVLVVR